MQSRMKRFGETNQQFKQGFRNYLNETYTAFNEIKEGNFDELPQTLSQRFIKD